jgi:hypothetical protein
MARGGRRPGAGRKPGRLNKRTIAHKQLASKAAEQGITPLELMLKRMCYYNSLVDRELKKGEEADRSIIDGAGCRRLNTKVNNPTPSPRYSS